MITRGIYPYGYRGRGYPSLHPKQKKGLSLQLNAKIPQKQKDPPDGGAKQAAKIDLCQFKPLGRNGLRAIGKGSKGKFL